ncbi:hypothetical protein [Actinokineospora sp.]|uniref:hypothetical protein n=1 Tax=Actinokineospora sp. TaxID=1872133 RepID=UPI003D6A9C13
MGAEHLGQYNIHEVLPLPRTTLRSSYGILEGQITIAGDWDSPEVNDAITDDFYGTT